MAKKKANFVYPKKLRVIVEAQRDILAKADALLGCLASALEYGEPCDSANMDGHSYADVALVVRELISNVTDNLDPTNLQRAPEPTDEADESE